MLKTIFRLEIRLSSIIIKSIMKKRIVINEPIDEIEFQKIKLSENIIYRRGIPFSPNICCGKNVILIDTKILIKLIFKKFLLIDELNISGNQKIKLEIIEKTTPIEST